MSASAEDRNPRDVLIDALDSWIRPDAAADVALAALRAAGYVVERDWQDISTAPRDGTRIQCYAPAVDDRADVGRVDYWWVRERGFAHMRPTQPYTHWRPLSAPPPSPGG